MSLVCRGSRVIKLTRLDPTLACSVSCGRCPAQQNSWPLTFFAAPQATWVRLPSLGRRTLFWTPNGRARAVWSRSVLNKVRSYASFCPVVIGLYRPWFIIARKNEAQTSCLHLLHRRRHASSSERKEVATVDVKYPRDWEGSRPASQEADALVRPFPAIQTDYCWAKTRVPASSGLY